MLSECSFRSEAHSSVASTLRKSEYYRSLEPLLLEDISPINAQDNQPIFFEQRYVNKNEASLEVLESQFAAPGESVGRPSNDGQHLVIFVHGFMGVSNALVLFVSLAMMAGNSYDLRLMRNHFAITFPHFDCFMSTANEESTLNSIEDMGQALASEVHTHISSRRQEYARIR